MKNTASPMLHRLVPAKSGRATTANTAASFPRSPRILSRFLAAAATLATVGIGAVGYFAAAPEVLAETTTINVNFTAAGHDITMDGAGAYKVDASAWNNLYTAAGTNVALNDGTGQLLDGITLTWSGAD
ncbi:MAG: hypothetical protein LBV28_02740, partial [Puniceicoccales bacterium]|nr:hypothetical protein [Puniceicoccales bacterium]